MDTSMDQQGHVYLTDYALRVGAVSRDMADIIRGMIDWCLDTESAIRAGDSVDGEAMRRLVSDYTAREGEVLRSVQEMTRIIDSIDTGVRRELHAMAWGEDNE